MDSCKQTAKVVRQFVERNLLPRAGDIVGLAVSGGADSMAMALLFEELRDELGVRLVILHMNHGLRGQESDGDEEFVREFAQSNGIECVCARRNVASFARKNGLNLEDAGRKLRHQFFDKQVAAARVTRVAVAHTADDQAETVLAKLIRGTGPTGLAGIYPTSGSVIRPLLGIRREELRAYLRSKNQTWREDSSNSDESRLRARIRSRLLPMLEQEFQPTIVGNLANIAELARKDEHYWQVLIDERFQEFVRKEGDALVVSIASIAPSGGVRNAQVPSSVPMAVSTRLIRRIAVELAGIRHGLTSTHVEAILKLSAKQAAHAVLHLPSGIAVEKQGEYLVFTTSSRQTGAESEDSYGTDFEIVLTIKPSAVTEIAIPQIKRRLQMKVVDWSVRQRDTCLYALDWNLLKSPLLVRNWRPGDQFRPYGFLRSRKVKRLLQEKHIPQPQRKSWPVLESAGMVIWARGFPVAREYAVSGKTRLGVLISEESL